MPFNFLVDTPDDSSPIMRFKYLTGHRQVSVKDVAVETYANRWYYFVFKSDFNLILFITSIIQ